MKSNEEKWNDPMKNEQIVNVAAKSNNEIILSQRFEELLRETKKKNMSPFAIYSNALNDNLFSSNNHRVRFLH